MPKSNYKKIILYGTKEDYDKLKEKLQGVPVSVWFRIKMKEEIQNPNPITL